MRLKQAFALKYVCYYSQVFNMATITFPFSLFPVTLEFVVLLLLSSVLTVLPLAFLLWQKRWAVSKHNGGFLISSDDTSKLLEDSLPNVSIQGGYRRVGRTSLTNFPA